MKKNKQIFYSIRGNLKNKGFIEINRTVLEKIFQNLGLVPPDLPRTKEVSDQVSFIAQFLNYGVIVHTTFNRVSKRFSTHGAMSVLVVKFVDKGSEIKLYRSFSRRGDFDLLVNPSTNYFINEITKHRPLTPNGSWAELYETSQDVFYWVDEDGKEIRDFFANAEKGSCVVKTQKQRLAYEKYALKAGKRKRRRREMKIRYGFKNS